MDKEKAKLENKIWSSSKMKKTIHLKKKEKKSRASRKDLTVLHTQVGELSDF